MTQARIRELEKKITQIDKEACAILYTYIDTRILAIDFGLGISGMDRLIELINHPGESSKEVEGNSKARDLLSIFRNPQKSDFKIIHQAYLSSLEDNDILLIAGYYINLILEENAIEFGSFSAELSEYLVFPHETPSTSAHGEMLANMLESFQGVSSSSSSSSYSGAHTKSSSTATGRTPYGGLQVDFSGMDPATCALIAQMMQEDQQQARPTIHTGAYGYNEPSMASTFPPIDTKGKKKRVDNGKKKRVSSEDEEYEDDFYAGPSNSSSWNTKSKIDKPIKKFHSEEKKQSSSEDDILGLSAPEGAAEKNLPDARAIFMDHETSPVVNSAVRDFLLSYYEHDPKMLVNIQLMGAEALQQELQLLGE